MEDFEGHVQPELPEYFKEWENYFPSRKELLDLVAHIEKRRSERISKNIELSITEQNKY